MKPNQPETNNLFMKLAKSASWWRRLFESDDAEEIHQIMTGLSSLDLAALDQRTRENWTAYRYYTLHNWRSLHPSEVSRLAQSKFATSLLGLASFHFNGHVREAAVCELVSQRGGGEVPFLLIRLNDWVSQVRGAAATALRARIEPSYAIHFLANISLVLRLSICGRIDKKFIEDIFDLLKRPECKEVLQAGTASKDKAVRRISFQLAVEAEPSTRAAIIRAAMIDPDATTRSWAARHFLPEVTPDKLPDIISPMLADRFMPVRQLALWHLATKRPALARQPLRVALLDNHVSMRETARQFMTVAEIDNARDFYTDAVENDNGTQRFAAICGLGETGEAADVLLVAAFLNSPQPKIRRAAVYTIAKLDLEGHLEKLVGLLSDPKPIVSREALKALQTKSRLIALADLETIFASQSDFHVRRNALTLICHADKWKKIPALIKACADSDLRLAEQGAKGLWAWLATYNRSFAELSRADFERTSLVLSQFESYLPQRFAAELRSCMKIFFK